MIKSVRKYFDISQRCGGAEAPEVAVGASVVVFLNTADDPELPASVPGVISLVEPGSATDTVGRYYTIQYDDATLDGQTLNVCDIISVLCKSCCVLLQEQIDAIRSTALPTSSLSYQWIAVGNNPFGKVRLQAYGSPTLPLTTIAEVHYFDANDNEVIPAGSLITWAASQPHFTIDIQESIPAEYPGGLYYAIITDSGGRVSVAATHVTLDDRLHELDKIREDETILASANQVNREILERGATDVNRRAFTALNPAFWGRDLNLYGVGHALVDERPCVRITANHLLVQSDADPVLGSTYQFMDVDTVTHTVFCSNFAAIGDPADKLYIVCFADVLSLNIPIVKVLPKDWRDWIEVVGLPAAVLTAEKKAGVVYLTEMTDVDSEFNYSRIVGGPGDLAPVVNETGMPVVIFVSGSPVLIGFHVSNTEKRCFTYGEYLNYVNNAIIAMGECPPNILGTLVDVTFWNAVDWFNVRNRPQAVTNPERTSLGFNALADARNSADYNTAVGWDAGKTINTGDRNTLVGSNAQVLSGINSNSVVIGEGTTGLGSNTTVIGNAQTTSFYPRGLVVIGSNDAPRGPLDLHGTAATFYYNTAGTAYIQDHAGIFSYQASNAAGGFSWHTGASVAVNQGFYLAANGRVGIGVVAPAGKLDVVGTAATWIFGLDGTTLYNNAIDSRVGTTHATGVFYVVAGASIINRVNSVNVTETFANRDFKIYGNDGVAAYEWKFTMAGGFARLENTATSGVIFYTATSMALRGDTALTLSCGASTNIVLGAALTTFNKNIALNDTAGVFVITAGATNGVQFGVAGDKLGFFGVTPIVRPAGDATAGLTTAGAVGAVFGDSTFDGGLGGNAYTLQGLVKKLKQLGILG